MEEIQVIFASGKFASGSRLSVSVKIEKLTSVNDKGKLNLVIQI